MLLLIVIEGDLQIPPEQGGGMLATGCTSTAKSAPEMR